MSRYRLGLLTITVLFLSACSSPAAPEPTPKTTTSDFTRLATLTISADTNRAELASYGGEIVSFRPEAGFAILGFETMPDELTTLSTTANRNTFSVPAVAAGSLAWANGASAWANGASAWANGASAWANGFNAWSSGYSAWANGFNAWSSGHSAWANGLPAVSSVGDNLHAFDRINLAQGQLRAPKLGEGVVVAVIDTGVVTGHPALQASLTPKSTWYDFVDNDSYPGERGSRYDAAYGHGTAVAGLILQVAPAAKIMPLRVLEPDGVGDTDDIVRAIEWAVLKGADIINISIGSVQPDPAVRSMLWYAVNKGVFITASAGNDGKDQLTFPAYWGKNNGKIGNFLLSVASQDANGERSDFSNYGIRNEIWAPGENLFSLYGKNLSGEQSSTRVTGTSFATPIVSGTLALALAEKPSVGHLNHFHHKLTQTVEAKGSLDVDEYLRQLGLPAPAPTRQALFVVGNETSPALIDAFLSRRLSSLGFKVTLKDDNHVSSRDASGKDLILISNSINGSKITTMFRHTGIPVIAWDQYIYDDMGMSKSNGEHWSNGIDYTGHELVGGQRGITAMTGSYQRMGYSFPTSDAQVLGKMPYQSRVSTFVYEKGAQMYGLRAPARRVGLFFNFDPQTPSNEITSSAAALFDVLVVWAVSN